ncbi:hypothetical protein LPB140_04435 [Sphingorhabdus lutea]|uniref:diguanylate cyclase n=1 Tax=Sphingorhabdus lutea TaxID=1913578 RepID=A0A1L3JAM0_9SPHN|nr:hypothetical protein LPB140_04435 [Sphingorhabdus lutea]
MLFFSFAGVFAALYAYTRERSALFLSATLLCAVLAVLQETSIGLRHIHSLDLFAIGGLFWFSSVAIALSAASYVKVKLDFKMIGIISIAGGFCVYFASKAAIDAPRLFLIFELCSAAIILSGLRTLRLGNQTFVNRILQSFLCMVTCINLLRVLVVYINMSRMSDAQAHMLHHDLIYFSTAFMAILASNLYLFLMASVKINFQHQLAVTDQLTSLLNRRGMSEFISEQENEYGGEIWEGRAILVIDIDHFKAINDQYGHFVGDRILASIGQILQNVLQMHGKVARTGGEEFMVVLNKNSSPIAEQLAENVRVAIGMLKHDMLGRGQNVTVSIGAAIGQEGEAIKRIVRRADFMMYRAKSQGRNKVIVDRVDFSFSVKGMAHQS